MSNEHINYHVPEFSIFTTARFSRDTIRYACDKNNQPWWVIEDLCYALGMGFDQAISSLMVCNDEIRAHDSSIRITDRSGAYNLIELSGITNKEEFRKFIKKQTICDWKAESSNHVAKQEIPLNPPLAKGEDIKHPIENGASKEVPPLAKGGRGDLEPINPVVAIDDDKLITTSRNVAEVFGKRHDHVIRDINDLISKVPEDFASVNFGANKIKVLNNPSGEEISCYSLTKDGWTLLVFGYSGEKAMQFKLKYLDAFNCMEEALRRKAYAGIEQKLRTQLALPDPANLIYKGFGLGRQLNALGMDMDGLAKLCRLRRAHATQADCAAIFSIGKEKIQAIERLLREIGISFSPVIANKQAKKDLDNLNSLFDSNGPGFPLNKGGQEVVSQEVTNV